MFKLLKSKKRKTSHSFTQVTINGSMSLEEDTAALLLLPRGARPGLGQVLPRAAAVTFCRSCGCKASSSARTAGPNHPTASLRKQNSLTKWYQN